MKLIFLAGGIVNLLFATVNLRSRRYMWTLIYLCYASVFFRSPWPQTVTNLAFFFAFSGGWSLFLAILDFVYLDAGWLTKEGAKSAMQLALLSFAIRVAIFAVAWWLIGF